MDTRRDASPLTASPLVAGLADDERREVLAAASRRRVARGQALFRQGEPAEALFLVEAGRVKLTQVTPDGREVIVRLAGPGELFAAIAALDGKSYPFGAVAAAPSQVLAFTRPMLRALFARLPRLESNVLGVVGTHARESLDRVRELSTEPVPQRLARALLRLIGPGPGEPGAPDFVIEGVTQQELADLTATTLYTVSRTLSQWEADGVVTAGRGRIVVRSRRHLEALASAGQPPASPRL